MKFYSLGHLSDRSLLHDLTVAVRREGVAIAVVVAHIAEVDARQLYREAGHPSMLSYCVSELVLSENEAYKRIQVARLGRDYPAIFEALAEGRLNLTGAMLLSGHLNQASVAELLELVSHKKKGEIERLLAERFPRSEMLPLIEVTSTSRRMDAEGQLVVRPLSCQLRSEFA